MHFDAHQQSNSVIATAYVTAAVRNESKGLTLAFTLSDFDKDM